MAVQFLRGYAGGNFLCHKIDGLKSGPRMRGLIKKKRERLGRVKPGAIRRSGILKKGEGGRNGMKRSPEKGKELSMGLGKKKGGKKKKVYNLKFGGGGPPRKKKTRKGLSLKHDSL